MRSPLVLLALPLTLSAACVGDGGPADPDPDPDPVARTTWHQDVAPIVHEYCTGCHTEGGIAPFSLETFEDAGPIAGFMLQKVEKGEMPPWHAVADEDCEPRFEWKEDARVRDADVAVLRKWVEDGAPEGDPDDAAALPQPPSFELTGVTHSLTPAQAYTTSGYADQQICFVLDPELTQTQWMTGLEVLPDNLEVVHHAVILAVEPAEADNIRALGGETGTFDCFGVVGVTGLRSVGVWVPGARPFETPPGSGVPLLPGSVLLMNIHYHPTGFAHEPDLTRVDLRLTPQQPANTFFMTSVGNSAAAPILQPGPNDFGAAEFRIPANVSGHTEKMVFPIDSENPARFPMTAMFPHMHYVGTSLKVIINRANPGPGEPSRECLINIPRWDFDWQRTYFYDTDTAGLPTVGDGDVIEIECGYDNTVENPFVGRMLEEEGLPQPVDVRLGDQTTDEMCLIGLGLVL